MITVYIASPYTLGDVGQNVHDSLVASDTLIDMGFCPVAPLLSHFQHIIFPRDYETWLKIDLELLSRCDALLRLPGKSSGADREVVFAKENGIPVVYLIRSWEHARAEIQSLVRKQPTQRPGICFLGQQRRGMGGGHVAY